MKTRSPIIVILIVLFTSIAGWAQKLTVRLEVETFSEDTAKVVPIYKFRDDVVGQFMNRFCDSLVALPSVERQLELLNYCESLPSVCRKSLDSSMREFAFLRTVTVWRENLENCRGVIFTNNKTVVLLGTDSESWLKHIHVEPTGLEAEIEMKHKEILYYLHYDHISALLNVEPTGKVDAYVITFGELPVIYYPEILPYFEWIAEFYRQHHFKPKCNYLQPYPWLESDLKITPISIPDNK